MKIKNILNKETAINKNKELKFFLYEGLVILNINKIIIIFNIKNIINTLILLLIMLIILKKNSYNIKILIKKNENNEEIVY
jgi:hypothetical protein